MQAATHSVGLFNWGLVGALFGEGSAIARAVYVLVGAGIVAAGSAVEGF